MKKLPAPKIYILMIVLAMIAASIACNFPDAVQVMGEAAMERCNTVSREEYVIAVESLGQIPEIPDNPENAVYEVCYRINNPAPVSARMYEGYSDEDENSESANGERTISIPAGSYLGEFPGMENTVWLINKNETLVEISPNGVVSGFSILHIHKTEERSSCTAYYEEKTTYTVGGQIHGWLDQPVEVKRTFYSTYDTSACKYGENRIRDEECTCEGKLTVRDGALTITCGRSNPDCGAYLTGK